MPYEDKICICIKQQSFIWTWPWCKRLAQHAVVTVTSASCETRRLVQVLVYLSPMCLYVCAVISIVLRVLRWQDSRRDFGPGTESACRGFCFRSRKFSSLLQIVDCLCSLERGLQSRSSSLQCRKRYPIPGVQSPLYPAHK